MYKLLVLNETIYDEFIYTSYGKELIEQYSMLYTNSNHDVIYTLNELKRYMEYDKLLVVRGSCIIKPNTPNMFDAYESDLVFFNEMRYIYRKDNIQKIIRDNNLKPLEWDGRWYNLDVFIIGKRKYHIINNEHINNMRDAIQYNLLNLHKDDILELNYEYNRCAFQDKFLGVNRLKSYIINYQGGDINNAKKIITDDIDEIKKNIQYKPNILILTSGGIGDEVDTEPVVRYIMNNEFKDSRINVVTNFPWIYEHMKESNSDIIIDSYDEYANKKTGFDCEPIILRTMPDDYYNEHGMSHIFFHSTDYSSMSAIKKVLRSEDKTIMTKHIDYTNNDYINSIPKDILSDMILIHPGKWWESKTFPKHWWDSIICELKKHKPIGIIGKNITEEQGVVDVDMDGVYNFVDNTDIYDLKYLLKYTSGILSNDSGPIHIAGAFDNWIFVIPTCKHPDHILPFRYGSQNYKTLSLYDKLLIDDLFISVVNIDNNNATIDKIPQGHNIEEYILNPKVLVDRLLNALK